jgi:hypothetical protein
MKIEMIEMMKIKYLNNGLFSVTACLMLYDIVVMGDELRIFDKERDVCIFRDGVLLATIHNDPDSFKTFIDEIKKTGIITVSHFPSKPHGTPRFKVGDKVFMIDDLGLVHIERRYIVTGVSVDMGGFLFTICGAGGLIGAFNERDLFSSRVELARELDRRQGVNADE